jgi:hypothetical protein
MKKLIVLLMNALDSINLTKVTQIAGNTHLCV